MSQFSNQLQASIEDAGFTQQSVSEKMETSQGQMSRYVSGENRPEPDALDKLLRIFPEKHRVALLLAYLIDDVPSRWRNLITITPASNNARITEDPPVYRSRMPRKLRAAYDFLGAAALERPTVADTLIATYEVLRAKA